MAYTRVKICGMTRPDDVAKAAELGVDFIGLNLIGGPRQIAEDSLTGIYWMFRDAGSPIKRHVDLVFLCASDREEYPNARHWTDVAYGFEKFQLYGRDYSEVAVSPLLHDRWWMVSSINSRSSVIDAAVAVGLFARPPAALLFDTASSKLGGTGQTFNWNWIAEARVAGELEGLPPIILAGGLTPDNVAQAIRIAQPYAVDVSSGVEVPGKPGLKDPLKMRDFIQAVRAAGA